MNDISYFVFWGALAGAWAFLFTGPLSESGMVFGWLKSFIYRTCPEWIYLPAIGCAKCNAFWWALAVCVYHRGVYPEIIILAVFTAYQLQKHDNN